MAGARSFLTPTGTERLRYSWQVSRNYCVSFYGMQYHTFVQTMVDFLLALFRREDAGHSPPQVSWTRADMDDFEGETYELDVGIYAPGTLYIFYICT